MLTIETTKIYASSLTDALLDNTDELARSEGVGDFINNLINLAIPLAVLSVFLLLAFAGYQLMTSQGNPDKLKEGKEVITNAIIGFVFILLSVAILLLISNIFDLRIDE